MKKAIIYSQITLLITVVSILTGCTEKAKNHETEIPKSATIEELGQMNRDFAKALKAKDAVAAAIVYDENASILPPNEAIVTGRKNIQQYWQGAIDAGIIDASVKTLDAKSDGDLGYEVGTFELKFAGKNGDTIIDKGKFTEILKRNADGKWISIYGSGVMMRLRRNNIRLKGGQVSRSFQLVREI